MLYGQAEDVERRQKPRMKVAMPVRYRGIRQAENSIVSAIARDLSSGGIRLLVDEFLSVFTRLVVEISVPSTKRPVRAVSKVAWIRKRPHGEQYEVGMQFVDVAEEDKTNIFDFVERSIPKQ